MEQKDDNLEQRLRELGNIPVPDSLLKNIQTRLGQLTPEWAARQHQLGRESRDLGKRDGGKNLVMAIAHFQNALHVYTPEVYPLERVKVLYDFGCTYRDLSDLPGKDRLANLDGAVTRYNEALNLVRERHLEYELITELDQAISECYRQRIQELKRCADLAKASADVLRLGGQLDAARDNYDQALRLYRLVESHLDEAIVLKDLGDVQCSLQNMDVAMQYYQQALTCFKQMNHGYDVAAVLQAMGNVARFRHEDMLAEQYYNEALDLCRKVGDRFSEALVLASMGKEAALFHKVGGTDVSCMEGMASKGHPVAALAGSLDAVPKKPTPTLGGQEYILPSKKPEGIHRSLSVPWRLAIAGIVVIVVGVILGLPTFQRAEAAPLSLRQSLKIPRSGATWVHAVSWSPNGKYIAVLWDDSTMQVLDAETQKEIFSRNVGWGYGLSWSPDSQSLASIGEADNTIQIWNISTRQSRTYTKHTALVEAIAWSPDGNSIASASDDGTVQIWNADSMEQLISSQYPGSQVNAIAWSPDGKFLVSGDNDGRVWTWDARTGKHLESDMGHTGPITSVSWSSDGHSIASSSYDGTVRIWNVTTGASDLILLPSNGSPVFATIWSPQSSNYLALTCYDGSVQVWNIMYQQGEEVATYGKGLPNGVFTISWSPQGNQLVTGGPGKILAFKLGN